MDVLRINVRRTTWQVSHFCWSRIAIAWWASQSLILATHTKQAMRLNGPNYRPRCIVVFAKSKRITCRIYSTVYCAADMTYPHWCFRDQSQIPVHKICY